MRHRHRFRPLRVLMMAAILVALHLTAAEAQERATTAARTDRTVPVAKGARLTVANDTGEVVIKTWDRDSLHVRAAHSARVTIDIQTSANVVSVQSRGRGPRSSVDYEITAPAWLPVRVSGQFVYIGIEGAQNEVSAETVRGDIVIKGGTGTVTAKSIRGEIIVEEARGRISANTVNESIRITGATGEIVAETTNGDIVLTKVEARLVDLATVNGDVRCDVSLAAGSRYRVATHNGDITMVVPENAGATFTVRNYNGEFHSNLPTKAVGEVRRGRRATYTLGDGGADVELESFGGTIRLRRPGPSGPVRGKERDESAHGTHSRGSGTLLSGSEHRVP